MRPSLESEKLDTMDSQFLKTLEINAPQPKHIFFLEHILLLCQNLASLLPKIQPAGLSEIQTCYASSD